MSFDPLVANSGRLQILAALAPSGRGDFVAIRQSTHLTDGNLASHARRLESVGFIRVDKQFRLGKPVTSFILTSRGRAALETHVQHLVSALGILPPIQPPAAAEEEWVD